MAATAYHPRAPRPQRDYTAGGAHTWPRTRYDEVDTYPVDISDLEAIKNGATCSSVTAVDREGVTVSSISVTSGGVISVTVSSGLGGSLGARVVLSNSDVVVVPMQWRGPVHARRDPYGPR